MQSWSKSFGESSHLNHGSSTMKSTRWDQWPACPVTRADAVQTGCFLQPTPLPTHPAPRLALSGTWVPRCPSAFQYSFSVFTSIHFTQLTPKHKIVFTLELSISTSERDGQLLISNLNLRCLSLEPLPLDILHYSQTHRAEQEFTEAWNMQKQISPTPKLKTCINNYEHWT